MGLSGLPMKVKFLVSLMFLLSVPKHQADLKEVLYCCERSSCSFSVFLSWCFSLGTEADQATCTVCTNCFQTALVRDRHLSYFTRSASWNPRLDLHPGKLLNLWRLNFPPFWSPIPVFCAVYESRNTAAVFFCHHPRMPRSSFRSFLFEPLAYLHATSQYLSRADPSVEGIKILNWAFVISFLRNAKLAIFSFSFLSPFLPTLITALSFQSIDSFFPATCQMIRLLSSKKTLWPVIK